MYLPPPPSQAGAGIKASLHCAVWLGQKQDQVQPQKKGGGGDRAKNASQGRLYIRKARNEKTLLCKESWMPVRYRCRIILTGQTRAKEGP